MDPRLNNALGTYFFCTGVGVLYKMKKLNKKVNLKIHLFIHLLYFVQNPHACAQKIVAAGVVRTGVHVQIGCIVTPFHRFSAVLGSTRGSAGGAQWRSAGFGGNFRRQCKVAFGGSARGRAPWGGETRGR